MIRAGDARPGDRLTASRAKGRHRMPRSQSRDRAAERRAAGLFERGDRAGLRARARGSPDLGGLSHSRSGASSVRAGNAARVHAGPGRRRADPERPRDASGDRDAALRWHRRGDGARQQLDDQADARGGRARPAALPRRDPGRGQGVRRGGALSVPEHGRRPWAGSGPARRRRPGAGGADLGARAGRLPGPGGCLAAQSCGRADARAQGREPARARQRGGEPGGAGDRVRRMGAGRHGHGVRPQGCARSALCARDGGGAGAGQSRLRPGGGRVFGHGPARRRGGEAGRGVRLGAATPEAAEIGRRHTRRAGPG